MSKDGSGRSSAAGSLHANSPDVDAEPTAPELQTPVDPVSATAQKVPSDEDMKKPSTTPTVPERATESQPMTASNSTSSHLSAKDASNAIGSNVPYGTRSSRNRTGAARPNYAEDKELDVEFEAVSTKDNSGRKGKSTSEQSNGHSSKDATGTRKSSESEIDQSFAVQTTTKEPIPGTSTFSAKPATSLAANPPSKKRKATSQANTSSSQLQVQSQGAYASQAMTRRASMANNQGTIQDSNRLSFETCGARLSDNKLVADDGTMLEVNGMAEIPPPPLSEAYSILTES